MSRGVLPGLCALLLLLGSSLGCGGGDSAGGSGVVQPGGVTGPTPSTIDVPAEETSASSVLAAAVTPAAGALPDPVPPPASPAPEDLLAAARPATDPPVPRGADLRLVEDLLRRAGFPAARIEGGVRPRTEDAAFGAIEVEASGLAPAGASARFVLQNDGDPALVRAAFDTRFEPFEAGGYYVRPQDLDGLAVVTTNLYGPDGRSLAWCAGRAIVELTGLDDRAARRIHEAARTVGLYGAAADVGPGAEPASPPVHEVPDGAGPPFLGAWRLDKSEKESLVLVFLADGSYRGERTRRGKIRTQSGTWTHRGDRLDIRTTEDDGKPDDEHDAARFRVEGDRLHLAIDGSAEEMVFERVAPRAAERTPATPPDVLGTWEGRDDELGRVVVHLEANGRFTAQRFHEVHGVTATGTWKMQDGMIRLLTTKEDGKPIHREDDVRLRIGAGVLYLRAFTGANEVEFRRTSDR